MAAAAQPGVRRVYQLRRRRAEGERLSDLLEGRRPAALLYQACDVVDQELARVRESQAKIRDAEAEAEAEARRRSQRG